MSPDPITRLNAALKGRYRVERELGEGGMATVYLADDLRHERKVALKVLKPELAAVVGAQRFLAEIKTTASLQHPHILPLFDSGEADSHLFYVMPYVEGETLRERLDRERQLPVDEAVRVTSNVAEALGYAHSRGVIHRDIKPANILLQNGRPVVSDFGIALAVRGGGHARLTDTGMTLGTPHYMSPEQATGDETVGPASDVYSLGCVLYEMLVGQPPYTGSTPQAILGKIIAGEAEPASSQRRSVPPHVDAAIRVALEKIPADRFRTAGELARALRDTGFAHARGDDDARAAGGAAGGWSRQATTATAAAAAFALLAAWGWLGRAPSPRLAPTPVSRLTLSLDGDHRLAIGDYESFPLALSPDGSVVVYVGESAARTQLYARSMDSFEPVPLDGSTGARQPFFSPDGQWVAYFTRDGLFRVPVSGGAPIRITPMPLHPEAEGPITPSGGAWGPDDDIVIASGETVIWRLGLSGEEPEALSLHEAGAPSTEPMELETGLGARWPSFLPASEGGAPPRVLVTIENELHVVSLEDGSARPLGVLAGGQGAYVSSGHLVFTQTSGAVRAAPFDLAALEVTGAPVPVVDDVYRPTATFATLFALSMSGTLAYVPGGSERTLMRVDRGGRATPLRFDARSYRFPRLSPSGNLLAVDERSGGLWIFDLVNGSARTMLERTGATGPWLSENEVSHGQPPLRTRLTVGAVAEPVVGVPDSMFIVDVGPGGRVLLNRPFTRAGKLGGVYVATIRSDEPAEVLADGEAHERSGRISPDGRLASFTSDATGREEVYVVPLDAPGEPVLVSVNGGTKPVWSASGDEVLFWRMEALYSARLLATDPPSFAPPELLFEGRYYLQEPGNWDVSPSDDFILISAGPNWLREIRVVQNLLPELERLAPAG